MRRRQFLGLSLAAGLAVASLPGCGRSRPLRMGLHPWIGYEPLYLAEEFGWLPDSVTLVKGTDSRDSMAGLRAGTLDGAALTLDETLRTLDGGTELVVIAVTDVSAGADALMVRPEIGHLSELRARRVAVEESGVSEVMMLKILERAHLRREDLVQVDLPVSEHVHAWREGRVDASVCYEPVASVLQGLGARRLFDSRELPETIFDVLVVTRSAAERQPDSVRELAAAHFMGLRHLVGSQHDSVYRLAGRQGVSPDEIRRALATVMLPDLTTNQRYLSAAGRVETVALTLSHTMFDNGMLEHGPVSGRLCNPSFLPRSRS